MKPELNLLPTCIVHPSQIILYNQVKWDPVQPSKNQDYLNFEKELNQNIKFLKSSRKAEGNVSKIAERKIKKAIEYLVTTSVEKKVYERISGKTVTFKIAFVTLTLPSKQSHPDKEIINKCLNSLLLELGKYYSVKNYVWRSEKQKNGNIHFHLLTDKFIPWSELRDRWNRIINKLGYVDHYREFLKEWHKNGFKVRQELLKNWDETAQRFAYQKGKANDYNNPNSTDIHSTKKIKNIKSYLTKYLTKNDTYNNSTEPTKAFEFPCTGRVWSCNHELSNISGYQCEVDNETESEISNLVKSGKVKSFKSEYFTVLIIEYQNLRKLGAGRLYQYFCNYLFDHFDYSEQLKASF